MIDAIILDVDDTLVDSKEVLKFIPSDLLSREGWDNYHKELLAYPIKLNDWCVTILKAYVKRGFTILFVTGRESTKELITHTLRTINLACGLEGFEGEEYVDYHLLMRPLNDYSSSKDIKRTIYESFIKGRYNVHLAIDDELKNAGLWKELGIPSLLVV